MKLKELVGSGDKIGLFVLPFLVIGIILNSTNPFFFSIKKPHYYIILISVFFLVLGVVIWIWSVYLILTKVPKNELIIIGPYSVVKHPLYTGVAFWSCHGWDYY